MSLLYTAMSLDRARFTPIIALARPSSELHRLYVDAGIETIASPGLALWDHSTVAPRPLTNPRTWAMLIRVAYGWRSTAERTLSLASATDADLVHLNSMPLSPSAAALANAGFPFVWHVREPPLPAGGLRYHLIRRVMKRADVLLFISGADRRAWTGDARGEVMGNFVDLRRFHPDIDGSAARKRYDIPERAPVVLYLGGLSQAKGVFPLLDALSLLTGTFPDLRCFMPGLRPLRPRAGRRLRDAVRRMAPLPTLKERFDRKVMRRGLGPAIVETPFITDITQVIAASNVIVFPATQPHFARPAIEAAAMGKPVVASRFPVLEELVQDGVNGLLVPPSDPVALASALARVLREPAFAARLGAEGRRIATEQFNSERQVGRLMEIYDRVIGRQAN